MKWYIKALRHYADFKGRSTRKEFWMFGLFNMIFIAAACAVDTAFGLNFGMFGETFEGYQLGFFGGQATELVNFGLCLTVYVLALLVPTFAIFVRRAHDIGKSGWLYPIAIIPFVGVIIVWFCTDSQTGDNKWGANPKERRPET